MCGIVGYIGPKEAYPILMKGLYRLEYRGYDSAGVALLDGDLKLYKTKGKVSDLESFVKGKNTSGTIGIGHTRWATHGEPNNINAHPHYSKSNKLAIIHNGIIENYASIKEELKKRGYKFLSDTDTEVLIHLIEDIQANENVGLDEAVRVALNQVVGAYAIVVISKDEPDMLIAARKGSPLVVGIGDDDYFLASDAAPIVEYTQDVVYLNDEEIVIVKRGEKLKIKTIKNKDKTPYIQKLELNLTELEKGGFDHFMLKEINEQPRSILDSMRGRLNAKNGVVKLGGIIDYEQKMANAKRIVIVACGTSWHAALVGEYLFEDLARTPVEVEYASEFRYRNPIIEEGTVVIAISQSGETADTLAAMREAKRKGATCLALCNVVGSTIAREADAGLYLYAGPEIGVASTKAFTSQITVLALIALFIGRSSEFSVLKGQEWVAEMKTLQQKINTILKSEPYIKKIAERFKNERNFLYLGRGYNYPVAMEGALKLKEISYIHAEGYPAAEMKHGPIALIDKNMPVVFIAIKDGTYHKIMSNIEEVLARNGRVIAIATEGDEEIKNMVDTVIYIPECAHFLMPILSVIPLQLLAYHIAVLRGADVDQPRNLAKSVTVE